MGKSGLWFTLIYLLLLVGISFEVSRTQSASDLLYEENLPFSNINHDLNTDVSHPQENNIEEEKLDAVLALLEKVQDQVNELQTNVDTMCNAENHLQKRPIVLKILEKAKCPQHGNEFTVFSCLPVCTNVVIYVCLRLTAGLHALSIKHPAQK